MTVHHHRDELPHQPQDYELHEERPTALGEAGAKLENALAALSAGGGDRELLVDQAADALWCYLTVRETLRLFNHEVAYSLYGVPLEVQARAGARRHH